MSLNRVRKTWESLAGSDPLWAITSHPDRKGNRWQLDEFFRTGEETVASIMAALESRGGSAPSAAAWAGSPRRSPAASISSTAWTSHQG